MNYAVNFFYKRLWKRQPLPGLTTTKRTNIFFYCLLSRFALFFRFIFHRAENFFVVAVVCAPLAGLRESF